MPTPFTLERGWENIITITITHSRSLSEHQHPFLSDSIAPPSVHLAAPPGGLTRCADPFSNWKRETGRTPSSCKRSLLTSVHLAGLPTHQQSNNSHVPSQITKRNPNIHHNTYKHTQSTATKDKLRCNQCFPLPEHPPHPTLSTPVEASAPAARGWEVFHGWLPSQVGNVRKFEPSTFNHHINNQRSNINHQLSHINHPPATINNHQQPSSCLLYTSPSPRDLSTSRMPSSA